MSRISPPPVGSIRTSSVSENNISMNFTLAAYLTLCLVLGRILRLLATNHIFQEIAPDVFTNNRISGSMDSGKSVKDIIAEYVCHLHHITNSSSKISPLNSPDSKYDGTLSPAAMLELSYVP